MRKVVMISGMNWRIIVGDVPYIIPLNTKDNDARHPTGTPVSDYKSSVDFLLVHPPT